MTILQLTPRMPWPLTDGGAIGIFNITKSLAELGHRITLVTFPLDDAASTQEGVRELSKYAKVEMVAKPLPPRNKVLARTIFRGAYPIERRMIPEMFALIRRVIEHEKFDVVHVDHSHMGKYGVWIKKEFGLPVVLREHNFETLIYERFAQTEPNLAKRLVAKVHGKRLKREEISFLDQFDAIAAITNEDAAIMRSYAPKAKIEIVPAGVNMEYFQPSDKPEESNTILWIGGLGWDPNYDAVRYFLESIFPMILERNPSVRFDIVGSEGERVATAAEPFGARVRIHGFVPDVRDFLARSAVLVVPLRIGGGMRLKLLDFFAAGKAVVATSIGAEGNIAQDSVHVMLRDNPSGFTDAVLHLLGRAELRRLIGHNARELVANRYNWNAIAIEFTTLYESALNRRNAAHRK